MAVLIPALPDEHPDAKTLHEIRDELLARVGGLERLAHEYPIRLLEAVEFVIDSDRTGRQAIAELDKNEKSFIGSKIEHFVRDLLDIPKGIRDLRVGE